MIRLQIICAALLTFAAMSSWAQTESQPVGAGAIPPAEQAVDHPEDRMQTPPPVTGQNYPMAFASEERANYLRYGVVFTPAYSDNLLGDASNHQVSDVSFSVAPTVAIDERTPRMQWVATYAPGFTFYQKTSARNESDQNASLTFSYRLTPHVTFSAQDSFQKSSNVFNQPNFGSSGVVSGGAQVPNFSVIAPIANRLSNSGNVGLTYQFALNEMIGVSGTFTNLHYPDPSQVPGLYDSATQGGSVFYSLRLSKMHYFGVTYQYQRLLSYPTAGLNETQTHAIMLFYTLYPSSHFSMSFFGGPQYSITAQPPVPPLNLPVAEAKEWTPAGGASLNWQGRLTSIGLSYSHVISGGGGLIGAAQMDTGSISIRQGITRTLSAGVSGAYTQNKIVENSLPGNYDGHSISGTASIQQQLGQHLQIELGYSRLHQDYAGIPLISTFPNTNREYFSISYQFTRPLGR